MIPTLDASSLLAEAPSTGPGNDQGTISQRASVVSGDESNGRMLTAVAAAGLIAFIGILAAGTSAAWVAGTLGISAAAAGQIVDAIAAGGVALAAIGFVFGAGIVGAIIGTVRGLLVRQARKVVVA